MSISVPFTGGCACGAIRYECSAEPMLSLNCHCRDCQRFTGSAYTATLIIPKAALTVTGLAKHYDVPTHSGGTARRFFCGDCGVARVRDSRRDVRGHRAARGRLGRPQSLHADCRYLDRQCPALGLHESCSAEV